MARRGRIRLRRLRDEVARMHPEIDDTEAAIASGSVVVDGHVMTNPLSLVRVGAAISLRKEVELRGAPKLEAALRTFAVDVTGRIALDVGASAGGFTRVLLAAGARRVYAVDAGHGQLLGSLRQDERVVNLEATNLGDLDVETVPETVDLVTIDVSYLSLARAVPQLEAVELAPSAECIALVKPQFELGLRELPKDEDALVGAVACARAGFESADWSVEGVMPSPVLGSRGSREFLLYARRR